MLEICATNLPSCIIAQRGGASRLELCNGLNFGGITPELKLVKEVRDHTSIDLFVLVRCRYGNFVYTENEINLMITSIEILKELNVNGVVLGCLKNDGTIDKDNCRRMIEAAFPMKVTFHRAFDEVKNPLEALDEIIDLGFERILTSGQRQSAELGHGLIAKLIRKSTGKIVIMPGAGINENNVFQIGRLTGATEFHASLKKKNTNDLDCEIIDLEKVKKTVAQIQQLHEK